MHATYDSAPDLVAALRRAAVAYGRHGTEIGHPYWYAQYMLDEQTGRAGPAVPGASP
jgi:hypothetical protein